MCIRDRSMGVALTDRYMREVLFDVTANTPTGKDARSLGLPTKRFL